MKKLLRWLFPAMLIALLLCGAASAKEPIYEIRSEAEFRSLLLQAVSERKSEICFSGWSSLKTYDEEEKVFDLLQRASAMQEQKGGSDSDFDTMNVYSVDCNMPDDVLSVRFAYLMTQKQEDEVDRRCEQTLSSFQMDGWTDYEKLIKIYEYVGTGFVYDNDLKIFDPYRGMQSGKMVCQGYSLLLYKLLWHENIPCRIITGAARGMKHAWNLAELDGQWYALDATWDACKKKGEAMTWYCFLCAERFLPQHVPQACYLTDAFASLCPPAQEDHPLKKVVVRVGGIEFESLTLRLGRTTPLTVAVPAANTAYTCVSTDPSVVSVDKDGTLHAEKTGECSIMIHAAERGVIPAMWITSVVDLSQASDWAEKTVEDFYMAGLLPTSLCSDFQKPITRAELTRILCPLLLGQTITTAPQTMSFGDIFESEDRLYIEYLAQLGIIGGTGNGLFSPNASLTREQAAKIMVKTAQVLGVPLPEAEEKAWTDRDRIGSWATGYIAQVNAAGLMQGTGNGAFSPKQKLTREQTICALDRLLNYCAEQKLAALQAS